LADDGKLELSVAPYQVTASSNGGRHEPRVDERKSVQEPPDHKDEAAPDDLSVVLGFAGMLSGGGSAEEVSRLATDHGWIDANGKLTVAGDQLAHALQQQSGTRSAFRAW
jgi:hypothetical protein